MLFILFHWGFFLWFYPIYLIGSIAEILEGDNSDQATGRAPLENVAEEREPETEDSSSTKEHNDDDLKPKESEGFVDMSLSHLSLTLQRMHYDGGVKA